MVVTITDAGEALKEKAVTVPAKIAKCSNLEPEEAAMLYRILCKMLGNKHAQRKERTCGKCCRRVSPFSVNCCPQRICSGHSEKFSARINQNYSRNATITADQKSEKRPFTDDQISAITSKLQASQSSSKNTA